MGRVERGRESMGHRVGHRDELAVEGPDAPPLAVDDGDELGAVDQARLLDAAARQPQREGGAVDREPQLPQQEREATHVVLVAMGDDATVDADGVLAQPREVRQHEVDAEHLRVGEHEAAIEQHDSTSLLQGGAVPADLTEAAQEGDANPLRHASSRAPLARGPRDLRARAPSGAGTRRRACRAHASWPWWEWGSA